MTPGDSLFVLIKSMSASEKRASSLYLNQLIRKGDDFFLRMFKEVDRQEEFDEEKLRNALAMEGTKLASRFSVRKKRLFNHLLEALRKYSTVSSVNMVLRKKLDHIELLVERGLLREASNVLRETRKSAYEHEKFFILTECGYWERKVAKEIEDKQLAQVIARINEEEGIYLRNLEEESELRCLHDASYVSLKQKKDWDQAFKSRMEKIERAVPSTKEIQLHTFESRIAYFSIHLNLHLMERDNPSIFEDFRQIVDTWRSYPGKVKEFPERHAKSCAYYEYYRTQTQENVLDFPERMEAIRKTKGLSTWGKARILHLTYNLEIVWYLNTSQFQKALEIVPQLEQDLESNMASIDMANKVIHYHNICVIYFLQQEWKKSLQWVRKIINPGNTEAKPQLRHFARLLDLAIHYELGNESLIYYSSLRSAIRQLTKEKDLSQFEKVFTRYIRRLCDEKLKASKSQVIRQLFEDFDTELQGVRHNGVPLPQGAEIILSWVESRASDRSLAAVLKGD